MAVQPRSRRGDPSQDALDLLKELIETPPASRALRPTPVPLRSMDSQRDYTLRGFLRRTWVDYILKYAERVLILAALVVFGLWFTDGPLRDWLHEQAPPAVAVPLSPVVLPTSMPSSAPSGRVPALLPYIGSDTQPAPDDAFLTPRQSVSSKPLVQSREPSRLLVPKISVDTPTKRVFVVDGVWEVADYAAGFMDGTALPGDAGNTVFAGHAGIRGAVFRDIGQLTLGDDIFLDAGDWRFHYRVRDTKSVWPNQVEILDSNGKAELTLITCTNWDTQRLVVIADLLGSKPLPGE